MATKLGDFIKEKRIARGMSKRELSIKAEISHTEVHRIESGERENPSVPVLYKLAAALGIPQSDILLAAGYNNGEGESAIQRAFPHLGTKQLETTERVADVLARNSDLSDADYDQVVLFVETLLNGKKK